jgi:ABC-type transport system involved in multi-copper enzyme maturation permease subunit
MKTSLKNIHLVLRREFLELRSLKAILPIFVFAALQFFISVVSKSHGRAEDTILVFQIGGILAIILSFDLVAKERENHTIDLLLTQGISRQGLFAAKWCAMLAFCLLGGTAFLLGNALGMLMHGLSINIADLLIESAMVFWLFTVYGSCALLFSVLFRRAKMALAGSVLVWLMFRPPVLALLIFNPLKQAFHWSQTLIWQALAFMPEFAFHIGVDPIRGVPDGVSIQVAWSFFALAGYVILLGLTAVGVFTKQDETM